LLLRAFARFEAALKEAGYCAQTSRGLIVEYKRFAQEHEERFSKIGASTSIQYLIANPPKRQSKEEGQLRWHAIQPPPNPATFAWLLDAAYQVRNNLFHGGKWAPEIRDPSRDEALLRAALDVLRYAAELNPAVRSKYEDTIT
jgi:hypothetical protein